MSVKEEVLKELEARRGAMVSGGALSERLGVSRTAVWKAITALRADGLEIDSVPGGGYRLRQGDDSLTADGVRALLHTRVLGSEVLVLPEVSSTNTVMKQEYAAVKPEGFALLALRQSGGRGRLGRTFASPDGGMYLTVLLRPRLELRDLQFLTIAAAVAVCRAIEDTCGFRPGIKWVNDVLMEGKKLCGILTEASIVGETGALDYVVVGIGINLRFDLGNTPELAGIVGSLGDFCEKAPRRAELTAVVLTRLEEQYLKIQAGKTGEVIAAYRQHLCCLDQPVLVLENGSEAPAVCTGVSEEGHLLVTMEDGTRRELRSGEISIRVPQGALKPEGAIET